MNNIKIWYLCDRQNHCKDPCRDECHHTDNLEFAKNYKMVPPLIDLANSTIFKVFVTGNEITEFWEIDSEDPVGIL